MKAKFALWENNLNLHLVTLRISSFTRKKDSFATQVDFQGVHISPVVAIFDNFDTLTYRFLYFWCCFLTSTTQNSTWKAVNPTEWQDKMGMIYCWLFSPDVALFGIIWVFYPKNDVWGIFPTQFLSKNTNFQSELKKIEKHGFLKLTSLFIM